MPPPRPWPDSISVRHEGVSLEIAAEGIRRLCFDDVALVDAVYPAARAVDWATLVASRNVGDVLQTHVTAEGLEFHRIETVGDALLSRLDAVIGTGGDVSLRLRLEVTANCRLNRWGLNVCLSAAEYSGGSMTAEKMSVSLDEFVLPQRVLDGTTLGVLPASHSITAIRADGNGVTVTSTGLLLEAEDQRNWTDPTYKIYSGSLSDTRPLVLVAGQVLEQTVRITPILPVSRAMATTSRVSGPVELGDLQHLPMIGVQYNDARGQMPIRSVNGLLTALNVDHVRVDVEPQGGDSIDLPRLSKPLEIGALVEALDSPVIDDLVRQLAGHDIARLLVHLTGRRTTGDAAWRDVSAAVVRSAGEAGWPIAVGSDVYFADVNRDRLSMTQLAVSFGVVPTVHLSSDMAIFASLPIQETVIRAARQWAREVIVSPITLRPRGSPENPSAAAGSRRLCADEHVDVRQPSLAAASWTIGSAHYLTKAGAASGTWHELLGPRGLVHGDGSRHELTPAFHAVAALNASDRSQVRTIAACEGGLIGIYTPAAGRLLIASLRPWSQELPQFLPDTPGWRRYRLRHRDTALAARVSDWWRESEATPSSNAVSIEPYEVTLLVAAS